MPSSICRLCGLSLPDYLAPVRTACSTCRQRLPGFDLARSYGPYRGVLRRVIRKYKFQGRQDLAHPLAVLLHSCWLREQPDVPLDWILPIPSHPRRKRERGLDHTRLLARCLSRALDVPLFTGLARIRPTLPQFNLTLRQRQRNLKGAFGLRDGSRLPGSTVLLVDDIMTTGTTVQEACRILKDEGAVRRVLVLTVASVALRYDYM